LFTKLTHLHQGQNVLVTLPRQLYRNEFRRFEAQGRSW